jgi:hypothetical protein
MSGSAPGPITQEVLNRAAKATNSRDLPLFSGERAAIAVSVAPNIQPAPPYDLVILEYDRSQVLILSL